MSVYRFRIPGFRKNVMDVKFRCPGWHSLAARRDWAANAVWSSPLAHSSGATLGRDWTEPSPMRISTERQASRKSYADEIWSCPQPRSAYERSSYLKGLRRLGQRFAFADRIGSPIGWRSPFFLVAAPFCTGCPSAVLSGNARQP